MAISEELQRRISSLTGETGAQMTEAEGERLMSAMTPSAGMTDVQEAGQMSDQDMNMMIANQGARQGISPVEQRAMAFTSYLETTDRTAPEEVVNNYAIGNLSFDDAIQLSQPIQVIDEVVVTGQMPDMTPTTRPCLLYTSPSPRDGLLSRMPSSA